MRFPFFFFLVFSVLFKSLVPPTIRAFLVALKVKKICLQCRRSGLNHQVRKIPWRREWLPILVFLPGKFHGQRSLVGYCREPAYCILSAYCILNAALSTASSFRIWNSSTGVLSLPEASVRSSTHDKGHEEGGSAYAKVGSSLRSLPGNSRASTPQTRVCLLSALCSHLRL